MWISKLSMGLLCFPGLLFLGIAYTCGFKDGRETPKAYEPPCATVNAKDPYSLKANLAFQESQIKFETGQEAVEFADKHNIPICGVQTP